MPQLAERTRETMLDGLCRVTRMPVARASAMPAFGDNLFTSRTYLATRRIDSVLLAGGQPSQDVLFADKGTHHLHLGRLTPLSMTEVTALASTLFANTDARFVVFEDIPLDDATSACVSPFATITLRYQANWRRAIVPGGQHLPTKRTSKLRCRMRQMAKAAGGVAPELRFERCTPEALEAVIAFNQQKIEHDGGRYRMSAEKRAELRALATDIGYLSGLYLGDKLIAGCVVWVVGKVAYVPVLGFDMAYQQFSPGLQASAAIFPHLEALGCTEVNFLWGDSRWKQDLMASREQLSTVIVARNWRILTTASYLKVVSPYTKMATKAALRPHWEKLASQRL